MASAGVAGRIVEVGMGTKRRAAARPAQRIFPRPRPRQRAGAYDDGGTRSRRVPPCAGHRVSGRCPRRADR
ncbi:hypothetical protein GCM10010233_44870 [Streptomyces pseudogriseolus]|nr:hypothetical protein GCM10010233_44870 [Streptomyces gancidicus]